MNEAKLLQHLNSPYFKKMQQLSDNFYEVEVRPKSVLMDTPTQLGAQVLSCAKRVMLSFVYDYIDRIASRKCLRVLGTDTDSVIVAISAATIDDIIKPESREWYEKQLFGNHETPQEDVYPLRNVGFFPRRCCNEHRLVEKKTKQNFSPVYICMEYNMSFLSLAENSMSAHPCFSKLSTWEKASVVCARKHMPSEVTMTA